MTLDRELHDRMLELARSLLEASKEGKISWATTDAEREFLYVGTKSSVVIESHTDRDGDNVTTLSLRNSRGATVDSVKSEFHPAQHGYEPAQWNELLDDLYFAARRIAYNVDEAIDGMLDDIRKGTPSPPPAKRVATTDLWESDPFTDEPPF